MVGNVTREEFEGLKQIVKELILVNKDLTKTIDGLQKQLSLTQQQIQLIQKLV